MPIHIDSSAHPIIRIVFEGSSTDAQWAAYHAEIDALMDRARRSGNRIGFVIDGRGSESPSAKQRSEAAAVIERQTPLMKLTVVGMALVLSSAIQRGVLTAFLWLKPLPVPHHLAPTPEDAEKWLRESLGGGVRVG